MRKLSNFIVGLIAAGVCVLITWLTLDTALSNIIFNLGFLSVMIFIIILGILVGFTRLARTRSGLDRATKKMKAIALNGEDMSVITSPGVSLFGVPYLDTKYQEYLSFLHKTNSPTDIGDYIGEYEINNYTHRRLVEMIPDILTSLGILGTFVGLVIGLRGFNPTNYESMSGSVEALVGGIKVAFVTSIYGLSLSLAYSYWLRGTLTTVSESLDRFLDAYYTSVVPPTDATAMNHVIANQNSQTKLMQQMQKDLAKEVAQSLSSSIEPMVAHLDQTMDRFSDIVTGNQERLMENIGERVARAMKQEFFSEFIEMRLVLKEMNKAQRDHLEFMQSSENSFQTDVLAGEKRMSQAMEATSDIVSKALGAINEQEQNLSNFVHEMSQSMDGIAQTSDLTLKMMRQMDHLISMNDDVGDKMMEISKLSEKYTKSLVSVQANQSDLSEGLSVMNDANIRMTNEISKMNDATVTSLNASRKAQDEFIREVSDYLKQIKGSQSTLSTEMKVQQENLRQFTDYMAQVLSRMAQLTDVMSLCAKEVFDRFREANSGEGTVDMTGANEKLARVIELMEEQRERTVGIDAERADSSGVSGRRRLFRRRRG